MKIGIPIVNGAEIAKLKHIISLIDYIEVKAVRGNDFSGLKGLSIPMIVHAEHSTSGVNFADPNNIAENRRSMEFARQLADRLNAKYIIVHPEKLNKTSDEGFLVRYLKSLEDTRILIESMPFSLGDDRFFCYDKDSIERVLQKTGLGFCLDFAHSSEAATALGEDVIIFVKRLLSLRPKHFHISDTDTTTGQDLHLNLGKGNLPIKEFLKMIAYDAWITLEVYPFSAGMMDDIRMLRENP